MADEQHVGEGRIFTTDEASIGMGRTPIDKDWSKAKKAAVSAGSVLLAVGALALGGYTWWVNTPPGAPKSAAEAVAVMQSARFENMDADRRRSYTAQASALIRDLPDEDRRELMEDEDARQALGEAWRETMDQNLRKWARGEELENPFGRPGGPRGPRPDGEEMTDEERAAMRERMAERVRSMMAAQFSSGDAQAGGLRGEMFSERRAQGGGGQRGGGQRGGG